MKQITLAKPNRELAILTAEVRALRRRVAELTSENEDLKKKLPKEE